MEKIRMRVVKAFSRNLDGQIVTGNPKHPKPNGRYVRVSPDSAKVLEDAGLAKPLSEKDEAREEVMAELIEAGLVDDVEEGDVEAASTAGTAASESSQQARDRRTDTSGQREGASKRTKPAAAKPGKKGNARRTSTRKASDVGGAPIGGNETNASTAHPAQAADAATAGSVNTNAGASGDPAAADEDAAPQQ